MGICISCTKQNEKFDKAATCYPIAISMGNCNALTDMPNMGAKMLLLPCVHVSVSNQLSLKRICRAC